MSSAAAAGEVAAVGPADRMVLRVHSMVCEADGVLGLGLRDPAGGELPAWTAGAHVDLVAPGCLPRQFSLCGHPGDRRTYRLGVLLQDDSRGCTDFVHRVLRPGDPVEISAPRNNFPLVPAPEYLFVAGGIGITPILPMLPAAETAGARWELLYGGRQRRSMAFLSQLEEYGDRVRVCPEDEVGRPDIDDALRRHDPRSTRIYCCGPEPLLAATRELALGRGFDEPQVERFHNALTALDGPGAPDGSSIDLEVVCARSKLSVTVGPRTTILEALEAAGVAVPNSCREGTCGTCETTVLEGVPDHRDALLTESERAANETMMVCCSWARTERLVLDV